MCDVDIVLRNALMVGENYYNIENVCMQLAILLRLELYHFVL